MEKIKLIWEWGTAYDFFASLEVLHNPAKFGLRGSWSAGVRSRLSLENRKTLEQAQHTIWTPLHWIYQLSAPKDCRTALDALAGIAPDERLKTLGVRSESPDELKELLAVIAARGVWSDKDLEALRAIYRQYDRHTRQEALVDILDAWRAPGEFGEALLAALQEYYEVFFIEEERRIQPALRQAISKAQALSARLELPELIEELSQGVRFSEDLISPELVMVPSFWISPLVILTRLSEKREIFVFGGRPGDVSLVPGESIPEGMLRALKALADPTRLRILRYLTHQPLTPTQLSKRLRLRAPTVVHHLSELRLSGLVQLTVERPGKKSERRYAARPEAIERLHESLKEFLSEDEPAVEA